MNYFPATIGSEKVTIDGEKVKDKMELTSVNSNIVLLEIPNTPSSAVVLNDEIHFFIGTKHYKSDGLTYTQIGTTPFYFSLSVVLNNKIYGICGDGLYKWDGETWTQVSTMPYTYGGGGSAVVLDEEIHILGNYKENRVESGSISQNEHYKWNGTTWTQVSTLPVVFYGSNAWYYSDIKIIRSSAVVLNGEIHVIGGYSTEHVVNSYGTYNRVEGRWWHRKFDGTSWVSAGDLPYSFVNGSAVVLNGEIHVLGGLSNFIDYVRDENNGVYAKVLQGKTSHYKFDGTSWVSVGNLPYGFTDGVAVVFRNKIHIFGGINQYYLNGVVGSIDGRAKYQHAIVNADAYI